MRESNIYNGFYWGTISESRCFFCSVKEKGFWQMYLRYKQAASVTNGKCRISWDWWNDGNMNESRAGCTDPAGQNLSELHCCLEWKWWEIPKSIPHWKKEAYLSIRVSQPDIYTIPPLLSSSYQRQQPSFSRWPQNKETLSVSRSGQHDFTP